MKDEDNAPQGLEIRPELIEEDKLRSEDEQTAAILSEVANSIHSSITVKSDYQSKNSDKRMYPSLCKNEGGSGFSEAWEGFQS